MKCHQCKFKSDDLDNYVTHITRHVLDTINGHHNDLQLDCNERIARWEDVRAYLESVNMVDLLKDQARLVINRQQFMKFNGT